MGRNEEGMQNVAQQALAKWGRIDVLLANAGVCFEMRSDEMTLEKSQETIDRDLTGAFLSVKSVLPQ